MPDYTPQTFRVPGCIPTELRQALEKIKQLFDRAIAGDAINITVNNTNHISNQTINYITNITNHTGGPHAPTVTLIVEDVLEADLLSGDTVVLHGKTFNAKYVRADHKLLNGTAIGALPNGTDYSIIAWNDCEVSV